VSSERHAFETPLAGDLVMPNDFPAPMRKLLCTTAQNEIGRQIIISTSPTGQRHFTGDWESNSRLIRENLDGRKS
jgi:hypothetical protein